MPQGIINLLMDVWSLKRKIARQHIMGKWNYDSGEQFPYGDDTTYRRGIAFLDGHGSIEDWGCGTAYAKRFVIRSHYIALDGSKSKFADRVVDLRNYTSTADCIFIRHVLEHNYDWKRILANAVNSFRKRMVLIIFTPLGEQTMELTSSSGIPEISFRSEDLTEVFHNLLYSEESLVTNTQYRSEHIFYIQKS